MQSSDANEPASPPGSEVTADVLARVRRGAELLDRVRPGWAEKIDLDELAMDECDRCVLGQLYGHFFDGANALHPVKLASHGFYHSAGSPSPLEEYAGLASAWRSEVLARTCPAPARSGVADG